MANGTIDSDWLFDVLYLFLSPNPGVAMSTRPNTSFSDDILAERGASVMVMRQNPQNGELVPGHLRWGLIPHEAATRPDIIPTNARAETITEKPIFSDSYRKRRAIVPIDAFHQKDSKGKRYTIRRADGQPMAIAAIWDSWKNPATGEWERTFATVTVDANATISPIHDRMPLILEKADMMRWLGPEENPHELMRPCANDVLLINPPLGQRRAARR
jgi:putative SOS response-associated peptidase YedK